MNLFLNWNNTDVPSPSLIELQGPNTSYLTSAQILKTKNFSDYPQSNAFIFRQVNMPYLPTYCGPAFLEAALENRILDFDLLKNQTSCSVFVVSYYTFPWQEPKKSIFGLTLDEFVKTWSNKLFNANFGENQNLNQSLLQNNISPNPLYSYYYKNLETLVFIFFNNIEQDLSFQMPPKTYPPFSIFYPKHGFKLGTAYGRYKNPIFSGLKPTPALSVTRFDRFSSNKFRARGLLQSLDPTEVYLVSKLEPAVNRLQYVYSVLEYLCKSRDQKQRPLFFFDKNYVNFFDTTNSLTTFLPTNENIKWVNKISNLFNQQSCLEFYQTGKAEGAKIRFDQYYLSNKRGGKMFATEYSLNYTQPFVSREKFQRFFDELKEN